jgi:hypothetical protein
MGALQKLFTALQHVLPPGFMKVRHYGFLSPSFGVPFEEVRARVDMAHGFAAKPVNTDIDAPAPTPMICSHCGAALKLLRVLPPARQRPASACASSCASPAPPTASPRGRNRPRRARHQSTQHLIAARVDRARPYRA